MLVKKLVGVGVHIYIGMLGYCLKDKGEDHFEIVHHNVINEAGLEEYVKFGTPFAKKGCDHLQESIGKVSMLLALQDA